MEKETALFQLSSRGPVPRVAASCAAAGFVIAAGMPLSAHADSGIGYPKIDFYGQIDLELAKFDGQTYKTETTGSTSRVGVKASQDLNYGLRGLMQLEHQLNPDDGTQYNSGSFWSGRATLGVEGQFGRILLGRDVNPSHYVESAADPFTQDGMAGGYAQRGGISRANGAPGAIDTVRTNNSVNYYYAGGGFVFRAQTALRENTNPNGNNPYSASLIYVNGPLQVGVSYLNPALRIDHWSYASAVYDMKAAKLFLGLGSGVNTFDQQIRNQFAGVSTRIGPGEARASFSRTTSNGTVIQAKSAAGYFLPLAANWTVYSDVVYDSEAAKYQYGAHGWAGPGAAVGRFGYDAGLKFVF